MPQQFPFSAVVGSDEMALALVLTTISPEVGGVLVRGEKGTAKSTIVRALAAVLPPIEVVSGDRFSSDPRDSGLSPDGPFPADAPTDAGRCASSSCPLAPPRTGCSARCILSAHSPRARRSTSRDCWLARTAQSCTSTR